MMAAAGNQCDCSRLFMDIIEFIYSKYSQKRPNENKSILFYFINIYPIEQLIDFYFRLSFICELSAPKIVLMISPMSSSLKSLLHVNDMNS